MKKVLITGGSGTIGKAFIKKYYDSYSFYNFSRNEKNIFDLTAEFPNVKSIVGDILDLPHLIKVFYDVKPDIVIHAAALKHVNIAETNPTEATKLNVIGSHNIIVASTLADVKLTVGISTDKACQPGNTYGYTKKLMEEIFIDSNTNKNRFVCTRFANVAGSNGSVIPYWKNLVDMGLNIKLTDYNMNRLMFSKDEAAELVHKAIELSDSIDSSFVLSKKMKSINMYELAKRISDKDVTIIGKRPGEKLDEELISEKELPYTKLIDDYILIFKELNTGTDVLTFPYSSVTAEKGSIEDITKLLNS